MARTLAEAIAMRDKVREAWEKSLFSSNYSINSGGEGRAMSRPDPDKLKRQLDDLEMEISRLRGGGSIVPRGITPTDG